MLALNSVVALLGGDNGPTLQLRDFIAGQTTQEPIALAENGTLQWHVPNPHIRPHGKVPLYAHPPTLRALSEDQRIDLWNECIVGIDEPLHKLVDYTIKQTQRALAAHNGMELVSAAAIGEAKP